MKIQGSGNLAETQIKKFKRFEHFLTSSRVKNYIEIFKWLFQIEEDGGIGGKSTCVQFIDINKELLYAKPLCYSVWFYERKN